MNCQRCQQRKATRPRCLCARCYYHSGERTQYTTGHVCTPKGGDHNGGYSLPPEPTTAGPHTAEKILVLAQRAAARVGLFHPGDKTHEQESIRRHGNGIYGGGLAANVVDPAGAEDD